MKKKIYCFGFRFEKVLFLRMRHWCTQESVSLNRLVMRAFSFTAKLHDQKKIIFDTASGFLGRVDRRDKIETLLQHTTDQREAVRNFAFAYRISMAEVLRISMEVYLDHLEGNDVKLDDIKHIYRSDQAIKTVTIVILFPVYPVKYPIDYHYTPQ